MIKREEILSCRMRIMVLPQRQENPDITRIRYALYGAIRVLSAYTPGSVEVDNKGDSLITEADRSVNLAIHDCLDNEDEGWLSEETIDDSARLDKARVWIVDPIDGTKEFVSGIPEWAVSVGLAEHGQPLAGGIVNPQTWEVFTGVIGAEVTRNDVPVHLSNHSLHGARILASRSEAARGEWQQFDEAPFSYVPVGSIAYKLALVASGKADATFTLSPKNEWDIAAGMALIQAAGGQVVDTTGAPIILNKANTLSPGIIAGSPHLVQEILTYLQRAGAL